MRKKQPPTHTHTYTPAERDKRGGPNTHHACTRTYSIYCIGRCTYGHTDNRGYAKIVSSCMDTGQDRGGDKVTVPIRQGDRIGTGQGQGW